MFIKDYEIIKSIEALGKHFRANISNRYTHVFFSAIILEMKDKERALDLLVRSEMTSYYDFPVSRLYEECIAVGRFIKEIRDKVVPRTKIKRAILRTDPACHPSLVQELCMANFENNLDLLAEGIKMMLDKVTRVDKEFHKNSVPLYIQYPELKIITEIGGIASDHPDFIFDYRASASPIG